MKEFGPRGVRHPDASLNPPLHRIVLSLRPLLDNFNSTDFSIYLYEGIGNWCYSNTIRESFCTKLATGSVEAHFLLFQTVSCLQAGHHGFLYPHFRLLLTGFPPHKLPLCQSSFIFASCYSIVSLVTLQEQHSLLTGLSKVVLWLPMMVYSVML